MIRVYVETNFVVDLLRPLPGPEASELFRRHGHDLELVLPWCSLKEAERTLRESIINEDIGFADKAGRLKATLFQAEPERWSPHGSALDEFIAHIRELSQKAHRLCSAHVQELATRLQVIPASDRAAELALDFSRGKRLKPFDEMILGCVLADAEQHTGRKYFCSLNKKDFVSTSHPRLQAAYDRVGIHYLTAFDIPDLQ